MEQRDRAARSDETSAGEEDDYAETTKGFRKLTARELEILRLVATGLSNKGVAAQLGIAQSTVGKHVANILMKMNVSSRTEASAEALRKGVID